MHALRTPAAHRAGEKLAILLPGMGAVATTAIAGVEAVKRGLAQPIGSVTQLGHLIGPEGDYGPRIQDALSIAPLGDVVFGGWDPIPDDAYAAAVRAGVQWFGGRTSRGNRES